MLTNATPENSTPTDTEQIAATQDSNCIIEHKQQHAGLSRTKHNTMISTGIFKLLYKR